MKVFMPIGRILEDAGIQGHLKEKQQQKITSVGEDVEKLEPLCTVGGKVKWCSCYEKQYGGSSKN